MSTTSDGQAAEKATADYLSQQGYVLIEQNWKTPYAEIDLVMRDGKDMVFVEVKYRHTLQAGDGFDYITLDKQHRMTRAAEAWLVMHSWSGGCRLMIAAVSGSDGDFSIDVRDL